MLPFFKIAVGTWAWGNRLIWDYGIDFDEKDLAELVRNAISKGSRYFFTSESFSDGFGEALLGKLAEPYPNAFLATKYVPRIWRPGRKDFSAALRRSLRRLRRDTIDLYLLEAPAGLMRLQLLAECAVEGVEAGKIRNVGVANFPAREIEPFYETLARYGVPLTAVSGEFNLLNRQAERDGTIDFCKARNIPFLAESPLAMGLLTGKYISVATIGLYRNNKLTTVEPKSIEELVTAAKASGAENPLCLPVGLEGDAYHMQPLFTSGGGYLFVMSADGSYDAKDMGVGKPGSVEAAKKIAALAKDGVLKTSIDGKNNISLFTEGKCAYMVSGPWALSDAKKANVDFALSTIPGFEGAQPAKAFTGAQAMFLASKAKNKTVAEAFLTEALTSEEIQTALYKVDPRPPALMELNTKLAAEDANTAKFGELAEKGDPMPNIKEMAAIWAPLGKAQSTVVSGDAEPEAAMKSAGDAIAKAIAG